MLITCPSCHAEYAVPGSLAPGRVVRCARCAGQWAPVPPPPAAPVIEALAEAPGPARPRPAPPPAASVVDDLPNAAAAPAEPARAAAPPAPGPSAPLAPMVPPVKPARAARAPLLAAWAGSGVLLAACIAAAVIWRGPVMQSWPPSVRLYAALGLTAHP